MASRATFRPGTMPSNTERIITEAATAFITEDNMREVFGCGPDASKHLAVAQQFADAGYDHLALINAGPDPEGFFDFFRSELAGPIRALTPST